MMQDMFPDFLEDAGEDSGVDSVSSVLEDTDKSSFTTSSTSLNEKTQECDKPRQNSQRSFLHDVYGRSTRETPLAAAQLPDLAPLPISPPPSPFGESDPTNPAAELAENVLTTRGTNIIPTIISLLDSANVQMEGPDSVVFITREGVRASLRLRVSNKPATMADVTTSFVRHRPERSSRGTRHSFRRNQPVNNRNSAPVTTANKTKKNFNVSVSVPPSTVAALTSKFNAIIQENCKSGSVPNLNHRVKPAFFKSKSAIGTISEKPELAVVTTTTTSSPNSDGGGELGLEQQPQQEQPTLTLAESGPALEASRDEIIPFSKGGKAGKIDNEDKQDVSNASHGVYETVRSFVKQAIRKFDKDETRAPTDNETSDTRVPNASFLWRLPHHCRIKRCGRSDERLPSIPHDQGHVGQENDDYLVSRGYEVIGTHASQFRAQQNPFTGTPEGYDEVRPAPAAQYSHSPSNTSVSYDEIRAPSVAYDELKPPSSDEYIVPGNASMGYERVGSDGDESTLRYEDCVVKAVPAVVNENQLDSISYFYDDIGSGMGGYGGSHHSYEAINLQNYMGTAFSSKPSIPEEPVYSEGHEVNSYQITELGPSANGNQVPNITVSTTVYATCTVNSSTRVPSVPASPALSLTASVKGGERRSETSDDWVDLSDVEEPEIVITRIRKEPARASARRKTRRRPSKVTSARKPDFAHRVANFGKDLLHNKPKLKKPLQRQLPRPTSHNSKIHARKMSVASTSGIVLGFGNEGTETVPVSSSGDSGFCSRPYGVVHKPVVYENAKLFSVFYDDERKESQELSWFVEGESDDDTLDQEPLYEVINAGSNQMVDDDFYDDDSFDSDELFEDEDDKLDVSRDRPGSYSGSDRSKGGEDPSKPGIVKLAEVAGAHMKRLRRNWSTTKNDIGLSLSRMKKRSTTSVTELVSGVREAASSKLEGPPDMKKSASSWSLKAPFRRKSVTSPPSSSSLKKESSTFYLTLAMDADHPHPLADAVSVPGLEQVDSSPTSASAVPPRPKRTSSMLVNPTSPARPKTAPPAPPKVTGKPPTPPVSDYGTQKRRLTRLSQSSSEILPPFNLPPLPKEIGIATPDTPTSLQPEPGSRLSSLESPLSRLSVASSASRVSSEAYMKVDDVASTPTGHVPNPQKTSSPCEDDRNYLDVQFGSDELYTSSHFADEPLYQFYTASVAERTVAQNEEDAYSSGDDDYEVIGSHRSKAEQAPQFQRRPTAMELVSPSNGQRTLWCELPEVINSGFLESISSQQRKIQEAMFEVITSEASYLRSLNVLVTHFIQCPEFANEDAPDSVLTKRQRRLLFSDILPVRECSERLLADLERRWQESVVITEICDILLEHATRHFAVYIRYCSNQLYQDRILRELKETSPQFVEILRKLESSPVCQSLAMHSFLMLPMQRITRLPLLVDAIFRRLEYGTPVYETCKQTLATLNKIVQECNEGARKMERMEEMLIISRQLDFKDVKAIPLMSASRWLVKKGEMQRLSWREAEGKLTFGRKVHKQTVYVFLFTDLLVVAKRKSEDSYLVLDYCPRNMVQFTEQDKSVLFPGKGFSDGLKNFILLTMLQNHENRTVEMVLSCPLESDRTRWLEAVTPRTSENPDERIYEEWDCPQVRVVHPYVATQHDELSLEVTDVVNVLRKMTDGWYEGERLRDGERGWFPGNYTVEIASAHVRARNLRQRYRLLAYSGHFLAEQLQREKEDPVSDNKKLTVVNFI